MEDLMESGVRLVCFSPRNMQRSKSLAEKIGLPTDWNCAISLRDLDTGLEHDPHRFISHYADWDVKAQMPHGVQAIRRHLREKDNVPLLVSLYTDSTPQTVKEMVGVFREYGEVVLTVGSALALSNQRIFHAADVAVAVQLLPGSLNPIPQNPEEALRPLPAFATDALCKADMALVFQMVGLGTLPLLQNTLALPTTATTLVSDNPSSSSSSFSSHSQRLGGSRGSERSVHRASDQLGSYTSVNGSSDEGNDHDHDPGCGRGSDDEQAPNKSTSTQEVSQPTTLPGIGLASDLDGNPEEQTHDSVIKGKSFNCNSSGKAGTNMETTNITKNENEEGREEPPTLGIAALLGPETAAAAAAAPPQLRLEALLTAVRTGRTVLRNLTQMLALALVAGASLAAWPLVALLVSLLIIHTLPYLSPFCFHSLFGGDVCQRD
jgi:hypothetical protein